MNKRNLTQQEALENGETRATLDATWKLKREPNEYKLEYDNDMISKAFDDRFRQARQFCVVKSQRNMLESRAQAGRKQPAVAFRDLQRTRAAVVHHAVELGEQECEER